ncbi:hypothetical protein O9929_17090 [Vibrio lentus]|nr:hypothetical protein [Vibrio lentus]
MSPSKEATRKTHNAWGKIYNRAGRKQALPLNDDEFLRAHWVMYFKYSRNTGSIYIRFLLMTTFATEKYSLKKLEISTNKSNQLCGLSCCLMMQMPMMTKNSGRRKPDS